MPQRLIDLSVPLQAGIPSDPPGFRPQIDYLDHGAGARQLIASFPGLRLEDLPGQEAWAVELVRMSTHSGTHMDAPYHLSLPFQERRGAAHGHHRRNSPGVVPRAGR